MKLVTVRYPWFILRNNRKGGKMGLKIEKKTEEIKKS
jgi:hypothetical protein